MKIIEKYKIELLTLFVFIIYLSTLAPGIVQIDSGELAATASTLGIAHPSGYPLFTILGFILTKLFFFLPAIFTMNMFASINTALGFYFLTKFNFLLFTKFYQEKTKTKKSKNQKQEKNISNLDSNFILLISVIAAMTIAFSETFWSQGTAVEVYSLHLTLISLCMFLLLKAIKETNKEKTFVFSFKSEKLWIIFAFFYGLAFTNHLTTFLTIPGFAYLYFIANGFSKNSFKRLAFLLIPFFVGLAVYLYLPIRASQNPMINWGNPITFESLIRHVRGWQYTIWMFSSSEASARQFNYFISNLPAEYGYIGFVLLIAGGIALISKGVKIFIFQIILIISTVIYAINYDIKDIDSYFLLAYISFCPFIAAALIWVYQLIKSDNKKSMVYAFFVVPLIVLLLNYQKVNESDNKQIHQYGKITLESFEKNSVVISYLWDFFISPSYYFQFVENKRKDVVIIDKELVRRSWYFNQMKTNNPDIYKKVESSVDIFQTELNKFENNGNYSGAILEQYYSEILIKFITTNINERPVYLGTELVVNELREQTLKLPDSLDIVPVLFFFKVVKKSDKTYLPCGLPDFRIDFSTKDDYYTQTLKNLVSVSLLNRATYEESYKEIEKAKIYLGKALEINPNLQIPKELNYLLLK